jgi:phosphohistidine phosphatase SixA
MEPGLSHRPRIGTVAAQRRLLLGGALAFWALPAALRAQQRFDASAQGLVVMLRHSQTDPGVGDPPEFRVDACETQRNLSAAGREQARRTGPALAAAGLAPTRVRSSHWCRCLDTATLAFGKVEPWAPLNSFFGARNTEPDQTAALRRTLAALPAGQVEVWVTHQVNVTALTGQWLAMGEGLVLRHDPAAAKPVVVGKLVP